MQSLSESGHLQWIIIQEGEKEDFKLWRKYCFQWRGGWMHKKHWLAVSHRHYVCLSASFQTPIVSWNNPWQNNFRITPSSPLLSNIILYLLLFQISFPNELADDGVCNLSWPLQENRHRLEHRCTRSSASTNTMRHGSFTVEPITFLCLLGSFF